MSRNRWAKPVLVLLFCVIVFPTIAFAQSAIAGRVADTSGAVLPGVTVEAASPVLIERVRSVVSDSAGLYQITNLRPGSYTVTFTLAGFSTIRRDAVQVPTDVTESVNVEMPVGTIEETLTVSGAAPVVDVQHVARTQVVARETMDLIPSGRDFKAVGATIPSVKTSRQNVGGTASVTQQGISTHAMVRSNTTSHVDGLNTNTSWSEGGVQVYQNDAMAQEISYVTSAVGADVSAGGVRINIIPRDGGNIFSGAIFVGRIPGSWQSDNVDQKLIDRGLAAGDRILHIFDANASLGGPIRRDRAWFFLSARRTSLDRLVANTLYRDGRQGQEVNANINYSGRISTQLSQRNRVSFYFDRVIKDALSVMTPGTDPETASGRRYPSLYYIGQAKWTVPVSSRMLIESGLSIPVMTARIGYPPGRARELLKVPFTPEWYAGARREDIIRGTATTAYTNDGGNYYYRYHVSSSVSYVTGSHNFKTGVQLSRGRHTDKSHHVANLIQRYREGVPDSVQVFNSPIESTNLLKADLGVYATDSWTLKRLTVNAGMRFEWFNGAIGETNVWAGRFVPMRHFPEISNVPDWFDVAPRLSIAYDLFGDARTAVKASVNRYQEAIVTAVQARYNPMVSSSDIREWRDLDLNPGTTTPSGRVLPTNGDDIAQDNEIGPSNNAFFGTRQTRNPADDLRREYNIEYSVGLQRQIFTGLAVTGAYYRRTFHNLLNTDNLLVDVADYTPFNVTSPLNGEVITVYNLNRTKQGQIDLLDTNAKNSDKRSRTYDGFELTADARLPGNATFYGGWTADRDVSVTCDGDNPNTFRFCDKRGLIPFRHDFKLSGGIFLPLGLQFGMSFQSYAGATSVGRSSEGDGSLGVNWNVPANLFPGGRTQTVIVPLIEPGSKYPDRFTQLDVSVKRIFRVRGTEVQGTLNLFNALNGNVVLAESQTFGSSLGQPTEILQGRLVQAVIHLKF